MGYVYLIASTVFSTSISLIGTGFNRKTGDHKNATLLYNLINIATALVAWCIFWLTDFSFNASVLWYSLGFGVSYFLANFGLIGALANGPTSLTALAMQLSSITAAVWGFFFWDEDFTLLVAIGLVLIVVALFICLYQRGEGKSFSLKWAFFAFLAFLGNSGCCIIQRTTVRNCGIASTKVMMFFAMILATLSCIIFYVRNKSDRPVEIVKKGGYFPVLAGVMNSLNNLVVILLSNPALGVDASFFYPVLSISGLALTSIGSFVLFRERLTKRQWIGMGVGAVAVALLAL